MDTRRKVAGPTGCLAKVTMQQYYRRAVVLAVTSIVEQDQEGTSLQLFQTFTFKKSDG
jgi:hypothetical protein